MSIYVKFVSLTTALLLAVQPCAGTRVLCVHGKSCLAPSLSGNDRQGTYSRGEDTGVVFGTVRIDPAKPTVLFAVCNVAPNSSFLGPHGNMADLFRETKEALADYYNVINISFQMGTHPLAHDVYEILYKGEGIISPEFLFNHQDEINLQTLVIHEYTLSSSIIEKIIDKSLITKVASYSKHLSNIAHRPDILAPSLDTRWILPTDFISQATSLAAAVQDNGLQSAKEQFADTILEGHPSHGKHYARQVSRLSPEQLAKRTYTVAYCASTETSQNYLFLLARMIQETNKFPNGITMFMPLRFHELETKKLNGQPRPFWKQHLISKLNIKILEHYSYVGASGPVARILIPNHSGKGYTYYVYDGKINAIRAGRKIVAENEVTEKDIIIIPTVPLENSQFKKAIALSFMEQGNIVPPLMTGTGSYITAHACSVLMGCSGRVVHDGTIGHLGEINSPEAIMDLIPDPIMLQFLSDIFGAKHDKLKNWPIKTLEWLFRPGKGVPDKDAYLKFAENKSIARQLSRTLILNRCA